MKVNSIDFAKAVKEITEAIPQGMVATYGDIAALAGFPSHARMVGKVLGCIGMESAVPCHRVVNATGRTAPHWPQQIPLLKKEGVTFKNGNHVDLARHRWNPMLLFPEIKDGIL